MTTLDPASAQTYRVYFSARDEWVTARPLLSAAGVAPITDPDLDLQTRLEKARDRVHLSQAGQQAATAGAGAGADKATKADQLYTLMQQLRDEVERIAKATPEQTPYAVFTDSAGRVVGKIYQDGGVWFDSDATSRVGGTAGIQHISDQIWSQTSDGQAAKHKLFDAFSALLASHDGTQLSLTGSDTTPVPFQPSARLLDLVDQVVALNPRLADNFSQWRGDAAAPAAQPQVPPPATLSFDLDALKATALKRLQQAEAQIAQQTAAYQSSADAETWVTQFRALMDNAAAASKRLVEAADKVQRYAIIRDEKGNQVGYIDQTGGVAISDARYFGLLAALKGQDGKYDRYDALRKALGHTGSIELTGTDVDLNTVLAGQLRDVKAARDALNAWAARQHGGDLIA